jgi:CHAT domain-containing protein
MSGLILSLLDRRGRKQDGYLRLGDIYKLKLSADLVVLSSCESALGKDLESEGIIGLPRGFLYAGAKSVIASLWRVVDAATAKLMSSHMHEY